MIMLKERVVPEAGSAKGRGCPDCRIERCTVSNTLQDEAARTRYFQERTTHRFRPRQTIFHEGTPSSVLHILCKGQVKLTIAGRFGGSTIVRLVSAALTSGEVLDKAGFGGARHTVTCETLTECHVCCISKTGFARLVQEDTEFAWHVLAGVSAEAGALIEKLREATIGRLRSRLARTLLRMAEQHGMPGDRGIVLDLALSRREWADMLGTSRESVARQLNVWRREGVLDLNGRRITILSGDRLSRLAL
jgi:CRP/FNR family transcriptional regulator